MQITERVPGDRARLDELIRSETDAKQRDRLRMVRLALDGENVRRLIAREFGVKMSLDTAYRTLHRLGYSCQSPRPRHENHDPAAQAEFREVAPLLSGP